MSIVLICTVLGAAAAGGFTQRAAGMGASMIGSPLFVLAVGPRSGVAVTNLLAIVVALAVLATSASRLDVRQARILVPAGLIGVIPGTIAFHLLPANWLQVTVGTVTAMGLASAAVASRLRARKTPVGTQVGTPAGTPSGTAAAGLASGISSAVVGAGGPPLAIYAVATGWPQAEFAATCQVSFALQAAAALAVKGIPPLPVLLLLGAIAAALAGVTAAHLLSGRINAAHARRAAIAIAVIATVLTTAQAIARLAGH